MAYTGNSIVDYLNSIGQNSSYSNRATLAQQYGISGYQGTAQQNTSLLNYLRGQGTNTQTGTIPQNNTVNANQLGTSQPFNIPPAQQGINLNALVSSYDQNVADATTGETNAQNIINTNQSELIKLRRMVEGEGQATLNAENQAGIPQINKDLLELQNQARQKNLEYQQAFTNVEGQKVPLGVVVGQQAQLQRQQAIDIAIANSNIQAKQGQLALAQDSVDRAIKAQFEPIYASIETQKLILQQNYDNLTSAQKKLADAKQIQLDLQLKAVDFQQKQKTQIFDIMSTISANGAPNSIINAVKNAKSPEEALSLGAKYISDPLDRQMKIAQIAKLNADVAETKRIKDISQRIASLDPTSSTYTQDLMEASKGGKPLTGDQSAPITKAIVALNQVGNLSALFNSTNTGPIVGLIRGFNPYDKDAQLIKGQIQSTLANLARSYGETGVLTDTDISRYAATLGKLTNPKDINQALVAMTLRSLSYGLDANLQSNAAALRDVSGYKGILSNFNSKVAEIDASIGVGNEDVNNYLDSNLSSQSQSSGGILNWLNKWIYGK